jgi:prepilin-type N-terminal cleavage/methylation domain-containing protein
MNTVIPFPKTMTNGSPNGSFHRTAAACRAFTLIELLVVIAIIAILAGLAFPAMQGALNSGKKAQARNDVQQIAAAIRAFELEYGRMPTSSVNTGDDGSDLYTEDSKAIVRALMGQDTALNPRSIVFLDAKTAKSKKGGVDPSDFTFYDPWGKSYVIKMDTNYNGRTEYYGDRFTKVIVLSPGPNGTVQNPSQGGFDDIGNF